MTYTSDVDQDERMNYFAHTKFMIYSSWLQFIYIMYKHSQQTIWIKAMLLISIQTNACQI